MALQIAALATVFFLTSLTASADTPKTIDQYWAESGLKFSYLETWITDENCYGDKTGHSFVGCLFALNSLFESPSENAQSVTILEKKIALVPYVELSASSMRELQQKTMAKAQSWLEYFMMGGEKVAFKNFLAQAKKKLITTENEARVTADAVNLFMQFAIDPHSAIAPKAAFIGDRTASGETNLTVGLELKKGSPYVVVKSPIEDGPAHRAGIRQQDQIVAVDSWSAEKQSFFSVLTRFDGENYSSGDTIKVKVLRGGKPLTFTLKFEEQHVANVEAKYFSRSRTGYVKIHGFMENKTCAETKSAVKHLGHKGARRFILDLRQNLGGLVEQAVCVAGIFIQKDSLVIKELRLDTNEKPDIYSTADEPVFPNAPLAVLIDEYSASASELLAGALQDYERAILLGNTTYGKGTVQSVQEMTDTYPEIVFKQTQSYFLLPSGRSNQIIGIEPDVTVNGAPNALVSEGAEILREVDEIGYALPNPGSNWSQPRPRLIKNLMACVTRERKAVGRYRKGLKTPIAPDYQLLYGEAALGCFEKAPAELKSSASKPSQPILN